jgi:hypothetical protein
MKTYATRRDLLIEVLPHNAVCAELGVYKGGFASEILEYTRPRELHLFDLWLALPDMIPWLRRTLPSSGEVAQRFAEAIKCGSVYMHQGLLPRAMNCIADGWFDWVYIDADHSEKGMVGTLHDMDRVIAPGGYVVCHDYVPEAERDTVKHYYEGVALAVDRWAEDNGWEMVCRTYVEANGQPPSCVLARRTS